MEKSSVVLRSAASTGVGTSEALLGKESLSWPGDVTAQLRPAVTKEIQGGSSANGMGTAQLISDGPGF